MITNKTLHPYQLLTLLLLLSFCSKTNAQESCGFGCLGLSSAFGGYSTQNFDTGGMNNHIKDLFPNAEPDFDNMQGFRVGINLFRAEFTDFFFTAKVAYQFLKDEKDFSENSPEVTNYRLSLNNWGLGVDFGIPVTSHIDWKILEGGIKFYSVEYKKEIFLNDVEIESEKYKTENTQIGYYLATGFIVHVIRDYISLEATALYNGVQIENVHKDGEPLNAEGSNLVDSGGFGGAIQVNLGVPL